MSSTLANVTAVAIAGRGLLIAGTPGSGKTSLALELIDRGAQLIGDDAVDVDQRDGILQACPPANTRGMIEVRNVGIIELQPVCAPVALMLELDEGAARFPLSVPTRRIAGSDIPVLPFRPGGPVQGLRAEYALDKYGLPVSLHAALAERSNR